MCKIQTCNQQCTAQGLLTRLYFVLKRLETVEHYQNEVTCASNSNDLFAATFAIFGALDNARQIQQLDFSAFVSEMKLCI